MLAQLCRQRPSKADCRSSANDDKCHAYFCSQGVRLDSRYWDSGFAHLAGSMLPDAELGIKHWKRQNTEATVDKWQLGTETSGNARGQQQNTAA